MVGTEGLTEGFAPRRGGSWPLLERDVELSELDGLVTDARRGRGRLALIEGEGGVGKTRLLEEARARAVSVDVTVLTARGGELERDFAYGIVRQLLEAPVTQADPAEREELFTGAAGLAESVFAVSADEPGEGDPTHPVLHGLYWLVANLSERSPLLLVIDDVHWADESSLRFLIHVARRIEGLPVAAALVTRMGEEAAPTELWRALALEVSPPILHPKPLSAAAVDAVVRGVLGADTGSKLSRACHQATGGNPFLLSELLEEFRGADRPAAEISPEVVRRLAPARIGASLLLRVGRTHPRAPALVRAVAVLGAQANLPQAARLAGLSPTDARSLAAALTEAAVLEPGEPLRFKHPIMRTAIYDDITQKNRDALHRRAARMLTEEGAGHEAIAAHLLATPPGGEDWVVETLRGAAGAGLARGAPETAAHYLRRALNEAPGQPQRSRLLLDLGTAEALAGQPAAIEHLRRAAAELDAPDEQVRASVRLAGVLSMSIHGTVEAVEVLERQISEVAETNPTVAARLTTHAVNISRMGLAARRRTRKLSRRLADQVAAGSDDPAVLATVAADMAMAGDPAQATAGLVERARAALDIGRYTLSDVSFTAIVARALLVSERFDAARQTLDAALHEARARGDAIAVGVLTDHRAELLWHLGELPEAEAEASSGHAICVDQGLMVGIAAHAGRLIDVRVERGDIAGAEALLHDHSLSLPADAIPDVYTFNLLLAARGHLRLTQGRFDEALNDLLECGRRLTELGELSPALVTWRRLAALAYLALGDLAEAQRLADEELALAHQHGGLRTLGIGLRVAGVVGGGERGAEMLAEAVSHLERSEGRLEHARALVDLGSALRRAGHVRNARKRLAEGMDMAHRCGARALVEHALEELILAGARPRRVALTGLEALTPSERRVATMAAGGMTNKEIAQTLFVTLRTIEMHLSNAYRKLEIGSRQELRGTLDEA